MTDLVEEVMCGTTPALDDEENAYQEFLPQDNVIEDEEDNDINNNNNSDDKPDLDEDVDIVNDPAFHVGIGFNEDKDRLPPDDEEDALFDEAPAFSGKSKRKPTKENIKSYSNGDKMETNHAKYQLPMHRVRMLLQTLLIQCTICMMPGVGAQSALVCNMYIMTMDNFVSRTTMFITSNNASSHCLGLVWHINLDWFQAVKQGNHSTEALYMTCCNNNPRGVRYLTAETFLIMVLPGPNEPNLEQLNKIMAKFMSDMIELYHGAYLYVSI
ncbi:hypothetical protein P692DRAFT_20877625 [Suillus brevipes Sb2]|nr:hypothetical protein P692DRAFT_20877625 [Suillus brevipes Sb2]